jgi:Cohesin domain
MKKSLKKINMLILLVLLISITACGIHPVSSQSATTVKVEPSTATPSLGRTFTVTISILNVQNLYGLEVVLNWDPSVLQATIVDVRIGVETFSDGVLHLSSNSPPIFIAENNLTQNDGEYRLTATSTAPAASFSGSGSVVKMTFNPISLGSSELNLQSQLYDYPSTERDPRISLAIGHVVQDSFVTVTEASSTSPSINPTATQKPVTSAPTTKPTSPAPTQTSYSKQNDNLEWTFVLFIIVILTLIVAVSAFIVYSKKQAN